MNWFNRSILALSLVTSLALGSPAHAQVPPPPTVPEIPDEPLPEWKPPKPPENVVHIGVAPQAQRAHAIRQAGLWLLSLGGAQLFTAGILFAYAKNINSDLSHYHNDSYEEGGFVMTVGSSVFQPELEDKRDRVLYATRSLLILGGTFAVAGFTLFGIGQARLRSYHDKYPHDPLPALSGYDR